MKRSPCLPLRLFGAWIGILAALAATAAAEQLPGEVDLSFDMGSPPPDGLIRAMALQEDGKLLIAGNFETINGEWHGKIARLNSDGTIDSGFESPFSQSLQESGTIRAMALQPDGKILVGGRFSAIGGAVRNNLARLKADGSLDVAFGDGLDGVEGEDVSVLSIAVQDDGRILVGGQLSSVNGVPRNQIARLHADGTLDGSFADVFAGEVAWIRSFTMVVQDDGSVVVGRAFADVSDPPYIRLVRMDSEGTRDSAIVDDITEFGTSVTSVAIQDDGKILIAGRFNVVGGEERNHFARLNPDGSVDDSFTSPFLEDGFSVHWDLALQDDGRIVAAGRTGHSEHRILRLRHNGTVDTTFRDGLSGPDGPVDFVVMQSDGKAIVGGGFSSIDGLPRGPIARLHGGSVDESPTDILLSNDSVEEKRPVGTAVGTFSAVDPDGYDTHTFSFVEGAGDDGNDLFTIEGNALKTAAVLDYEINVMPSIRVRATDEEGLFVEKVFVIEVMPDPAPRELSLSNNLVFENRPAGTPVGVLSASGRDPSQTYTFALVEGEGDDGNASFAVEDDTLVSGTEFMRDEQEFYSIRVRATNADGYFLEKVFLIEVQANLPPTDILLSGTAFSENLPAGSLVAIMEAVDPDVFNTHTFSLVPGEGDEGNGAFAIEDDRLLTAATFDYELQNTYSIRIRATNADDLFLEKPVTLTLEPNQAPAGIGLNSYVVTEGHRAGTPVAAVSAVDPDPCDGHTFSLVDGDGDAGNAFFDIEGSVLKTAAVFDAAEQSEYSVRIRATDMRGAWIEEVFVIQVVPLPSPGQFPGDVDAAFVLEAAAADDRVWSVVLQEDGKILVGGEFETIGGVTRSRIARLNADGTLDTSFPDAGVDWEGHSFLPFVEAIALQDDGKILFGGSFNRVHGEARSSLARFHPDGSLDTEFAPELEHRILAIVVQDDGKIVIAGGFTEIDGVARNGIARLHPDGSLDLSFGHGQEGVGKGWSWINMWEVDGWIDSIVVQPDGKLLVGGEFVTLNGVPRSRIARLNTDGSLDTTFGDESDEIRGWVNSVALEPDGSVLVGGGFAEAYGLPRYGLVRLHADGSLDTDFPGLDVDDWASVSSIGLQGDGRILVGGDIYDLDGVPQRHLARLYPDGTLDPSFLHEQSGPDDFVYSIAVQQDGAIIIGGAFGSVNGIPAERVARLHGGSALSLADGPEQILVSAHSTFEGQPEGTRVGYFTASDPDGDESHSFSLVAGEGDDDNASFTLDGAFLRTAAVFEAASRDSYTLRVRATNTAGAFVEETFTISVYPLPVGGQLHLDPSFDAGSSINNAVRAVAQQADGRWLIGGEFQTVHGAARGRIARLNTDGSTDPTFMDGLTGANGRVRAIAVQDDGRILIGGRFTHIHGEPAGRIARLHPDGSLDETFIGEVYPGGVTFPEVRSIAIQDDGKIVIGGDFFSVNGHLRTRIARLHPDGAIDMDFGAGLSGADAPVASVAVQDDGGIVVGGAFTSINGEPRNGIARLQPDGTVDAGFGAGSSGADGVFSVAVDDDQTVLIGGAFETVNGTPRRHLARLRADGSLEGGFGSDTGGPNGRVDAIVVQPDGRILVSGAFTEVDGETRWRVARMTSTGILDTDFGDGLSGANSAVAALGLQDDGKVLAAGFFAEPRLRIARLHPDGTPDDGFANGLPGPDLSVRAVVRSNDGTVLAGGAFATVQGEASGRIARFGADGTLDAGFGAGLAGANGLVLALAEQPDGRILVAGDFTSVNGEPRNRIARLHADGTLDESFGEGLALADARVGAVALQPDGKIVIGGGFTAVNGVSRNRIARLNPDGSLDSGFGSGQAGADATVMDVVVEDNGNILIGGFFNTVNGVPRQKIARLHANGTLNTSFGAGSFSPGAVRAIAVQNDGNIVIGGGFTEVRGEPRNRIARLHWEGSLDTTFGDGLAGANGVVHSVAVQPDGRILIAGPFSSVNQRRRNGFARLHPDGTVDHGLEGASSWFVNAVAVLPDGNVLIGGAFTLVNGIPRERVARLYGGAAPWNEPPVDIVLGNHTVMEQRPPGRVVGTLSAVDPDEDDVHSFEFVEGEGDGDNNLFTIDGETLKTAEVLDYATASIHTVRIRATDTGLLSVEKALTIEVEPNRAPVDIVLSHDSVPELEDPGTTVGAVSAVDPDEDDVHAFALVAGDGDEDNAGFVIEDDLLKTAAVLDYYEQTSHTVRIRATDLGGLYVEKTFTIAVEQETYRAWAEALPEDERELEDDPGGYGIPNLLRYAFGMDPLRPDPSQLPQIEARLVPPARGGGDPVMRLSITYTRRNDDGELDYFVEASEYLVTWFPAWGTDQILENHDDGTESVVFIESQSMDGRTAGFLRVRVRR